MAVWYWRGLRLVFQSSGCLQPPGSAPWVPASPRGPELQRAVSVMVPTAASPGSGAAVVLSPMAAPPWDLILRDNCPVKKQVKEGRAILAGRLDVPLATNTIS